MDRPESEVLDGIIDRLAEIEELEERAEKARALLKEHAEAISSIPGQSIRLRVARYVYWMLPDVRVADIARGLGQAKLNKKFWQLIGGNAINLECQDCNEEIKVKSRAEMARILKDAKHGSTNRASRPQFFCHTCIEARRVQNSERMEREYQLRRQRLRRLQTMPYGEYLKTTEWQKKRKWHEWELERLASPTEDDLEQPTCQNCDERRGLSLFHKASAQLGSETRDDILLLCGACAESLDQRQLLKRV